MMEAHGSGMKGLVLSLAVFAAYVLCSVLTFHFFKPRRQLAAFAIVFCAATPVYFAGYWALPASLGFLPEAWQAKVWWLDALYGYAVLALNAHSFVDFFFGFNGGFSMSLMLGILEAGSAGMSASELAGGFALEDGTDKVYKRRLRHLADAKLIEYDAAAGVCAATAMGRRVAGIALALKRFLNLGLGG